MMSLSVLTAAVRQGSLLSAPQIREACEALFDKAADSREKADFLKAFHLRGETPDEIAAFVETILDRGDTPEIPHGDCIDVCGTGGDKAGLFNVSTAVMFVAAACGARVVKHGNRAVTSKSGSADVLEALGISLEVPPAHIGAVLEHAGCCFLFAPFYHTSLRAVAPARKLLAEEGMRTVFNILGPLVSPARPTHQLVGVFAEETLGTYAEVLRAIGRKKAWVAHGSGPGGLCVDEISTLGPSRILKLENGVIEETSLDPLEYGIPSARLEDLLGSDATGNAAILLDLLRDKHRGAIRDIVVLNTAAALVIAEIAPGLSEGIRMAEEKISDGSAYAVLERLREAS